MTEYQKILPTPAILGLLLVTGCTWVKPEPGSERVRIVTAEEAAGCQRIGTASASVRDRVLAVQRKPGKVAAELDTLARGSALDLGGDTLVPAGPVVDGKRDYIVYRCRP